MESTLINQAVRALLDKLVSDLQGYRWDSLCSFSDGRGMTVIELNVWRKDGQESVGNIAYQLETGDVLKFYYPPIGKMAPEPVVDFLLDMYNLERRMFDANRSLL